MKAIGNRDRRRVHVHDVVIDDPQAVSTGGCEERPLLDLHHRSRLASLPPSGTRDSGVVRSVGPGVTSERRRPCRRLSITSAAPAQSVCPPTLCSNPTAVARKEGEKPRVSFPDGQEIAQSVNVGGFAEQVLVHENQLAVVNNQIPFPQAALLGCSVVTGAGAAINTAHVRPGDTVAVIGTGGIGLNAISGARLAGAKHIIAMTSSTASSRSEEIRRHRPHQPSTTDPVAAVQNSRVSRPCLEVIGLKPPAPGQC